MVTKNIAADLCISQRTVENHRASIMHKAGAKSLVELARLALHAGWPGGEAAMHRRAFAPAMDAPIPA
jgi:two-component system CheB/CheR fusion protein